MLPEPDALKTAIVTGATGFLGSHLCCLLLKEGYAVKGLKRSESQGLLPEVAARTKCSLTHFSWIECQLSEPDLLATNFIGADVVFHCAAKVSFDRRDANDILETNVNGTTNVVNACLQANVPALIHASSVAALGRKGASNRIDESCEWTDSEWNTTYAISKHLAEMEVWRGSEEGLKVAMVNPGIILGYNPGKTGTGMLFEHIRSKSRYYPSGINGFVGVDDTARILQLMYEKELFNQKMLVVAENLPYKTVLDYAAAALGMPAPDKPLDGFLLKLAIALARTAEVLHLPFPFPSAGLKNTSSKNEYHSVNTSLNGVFEYTPVESVMRAAL